MAREPSPEIDDELFSEVYGKTYSGPVASSTNSVMPKVNEEKKPLTRDKSDDEDGAPDPNAIPTDFTSREAKVWEAKAKATERNWKKRKEEESICKICGDSGHFTQGCPSTLGSNRRNAEFFERVPARDKQVRNLFTERMISQIEKDVGCKIRMDEKFLFVSGKDSHLELKCNMLHLLPFTEAYANFGAKGRPAQSKSPHHSSYFDDSPRTHGENNQFAASHMANNWGIERHGADACSGLKFDMPSHQHTLEELEVEFKREATELARARDQEEDEENYKHRESLRVMRENYMDRVTTMRNVHARKWEEFLEQTLKRQQQAHTSYTQIGYPGLEQRTTHISAALQPMDSKSTYPYASDNYSAPKAHAAYGELQHDRHGDLGRTYGRY
ncbi:hypothetical protein BAE44_0023815 [Dichanthelium oligosanthes]|uniref:CCHC-type domain-containing protein n=1 Tax=Dichanthelium oligosanthes TaxID=888268 RepID=A0A1E5UQM4_9POAL|nr:hypothetical protein BAE44_0023815 [Dichanthelium oligosanthes]